MRQVVDWLHYWCGMAKNVSSRSKDPNTNVGAVAVGRFQNTLSTGYNGFPPKVKETPERWARPKPDRISKWAEPSKYEFVCHAEENVVALAARPVLEGSTVYVTHFPCSGCAKQLITAGVVKVVCGAPPHGWDEEHEFSKVLFAEAGVEVCQVPKEYFDGQPIRT